MSHRDDCMTEEEAERLARERARRHFNAGMEGWSRPPSEVGECEESENAYRSAYRREQNRLSEQRQEEEQARRYQEEREREAEEERAYWESQK